MDSPFARELAEYVETQAGIAASCVRVEFGGKHPRIVWHSRALGRDRFYVCSATPSDFRSRANARSQLRRMLRDDGDLLCPSAEEIAVIEAAKASRQEEADRRAIEKLIAQREAIERRLKNLQSAA